MHKLINNRRMSLMPHIRFLGPFDVNLEIARPRRAPSVLFYACTLLTRTMARETQISRRQQQHDSYPL